MQQVSIKCTTNNIEQQANNIQQVFLQVDRYLIVAYKKKNNNI